MGGTQEWCEKERRQKQQKMSEGERGREGGMEIKRAGRERMGTVIVGDNWLRGPNRSGDV